jgi:hypothetical protein
VWSRAAALVALALLVPVALVSDRLPLTGLMTAVVTALAATG